MILLILPMFYWQKKKEWHKRTFTELFFIQERYILSILFVVCNKYVAKTIEWEYDQRWSKYIVHCRVIIILIAILLFFYQVFQGTEERPSKWHLFIVFQNWTVLLNRLAIKVDLYMLFIYYSFNVTRNS